MIDKMLEICCILIWLLFVSVLVALIISVFRDAYNLDKKLKKKDINHIKKQAYREFANRLKNKSLTKWDYNEAVDVEEIDKTLIELIRSII